jgi:hypothetical protein
VELENIKLLVATLRNLGVTRYRDDRVELELGPAGPAEPQQELAKQGFPKQKPVRSDRLQEALDQLGPVYGELLDVR